MKFLSVFGCLVVFLTFSCKEKDTNPLRARIDEMELKRGKQISCGVADKEFGLVTFESSCAGEREDLNLAMELLHSFEYEEAEKVFARIIDANPECAMAYWGVAMSNFHALWTPPSLPELVKGTKAIEIARAVKKTKREADYVDAIAAFYTDWKSADHQTRCLRFEKAMERLYAAYPNDKEAAIFYALALNAAVDPADRSLSKQKKAGALLQTLYPENPNHPGIIHYIIHTYDNPELAQLALPAARKYAAVAPSSAHALHMPSHIFTRLGLWDESIESNLESISSAKCYAEAAGIKGHWDEELHGMDYLVYAYLQTGANQLAKQQLDYMETIDVVHPVNFKVAYAFAAIPSRYYLENKLWEEASRLKMHRANISWKDFQWQEAIVHFARLLGFVNRADRDSARLELKELNRIRDLLTSQKDEYKTGQLQIQITASEAWIRFSEHREEEALRLMQLAADLEDRTEKHPVTPGEVVPARELLGDLLVQMNRWPEALEAYEANLKKHPRRFNGLYGAGLAAHRSGDLEKAGFYYRQLLTMADSANSTRPELATVRRFLEERTGMKTVSGGP